MSAIRSWLREGRPTHTLPPKFKTTFDTHVPGTITVPARLSPSDRNSVAFRRIILDSLSYTLNNPSNTRPSDICTRTICPRKDLILFTVDRVSFVDVVSSFVVVLDVMNLSLFRILLLSIY